ncbi:MAG: DUF4845 domain-containing protein [Nitrosomonas sp. PRO4]|nr:DUF4845 domain-containing protein [Nitrosomonas sp. PRO4]
MRFYKALYEQRGISLSGMLIWSVVLILVALLGFKVLPAYIEYSAIKKNLTAIAKESNSQDTDLSNIRVSFAKRAQIDGIKTISGQDIKINREKGRSVLSVNYSTKIPLFSNVSLLIDFEVASE